MKYSLGALLMIGSLALGQTREHAQASITVRLPAPPAVVFPLFGPVREAEWAPHWNPTILYPPDRDRRQSAGAVFTTRQLTPGQHDRDVVWVLTTYDEAALRIGYVIVRPAINASQLDITLKPIGEKETEATVTHRLTSLSEEGDAFVKEFAAEFPLERDHWEQAISGRLRELTRR
jgi:hypothetical protein